MDQYGCYGKMALITKLSLILFDYFDFPERSWNVCTDCNGYFGCAIAEIAINPCCTLMSKFIALLYIMVIVILYIMAMIVVVMSQIAMLAVMGAA